MNATRGGHKAGQKVLGSFISTSDWKSILSDICSWASTRESRYICTCNVHSVVTARMDAAFKDVINSADMALPDGMPVVWLMRRDGFKGQQRISGPDLMWRLCEQALERGLPIFFLGNTEKVLGLLTQRLSTKFPELKIAGIYSPPFGTFSAQENEKIAAMINGSGANIVFVSLGCPKQEFWIAEQRGRINAVMIGVGAAFDFIAGTVKRAPLWMQRSGLEWFYRLISEPRRLWKRYLVTNTLFIFYVLKDILSLRRVSD
ncbi:MAG: glycosyltransferase [Nitrospirae bacterium]|nr:MAG: glycosyltransferase [Nitrospirota bacterium]